MSKKSPQSTAKNKTESPTTAVAGTAEQGERASGPTGKHKYIQLPTPPNDSFADGAHGIILGRNVLKLDLYRVVGFDSENKEEIRAISHRLVLPTTAVPELINLLQSIVRAVQQTSQRKAKDQPDSTESQPSDAS